MSNDLLTNGDMEAGSGDVFTGWSTVNTTEETVNIHGGSRAMIVTDGDSWSLSANTLQPGHTYELSFWCTGDGTNEATFGIFDYTNGAYISLSAVSTGITGETYTQVSYQFFAPAGCTRVAIYLRSKGGGGGKYARFDDVSLQAIAFAMLPARLLPMLWPESMNLWLTGTGVVPDVDSDPIVRRVPSTASTPLRNVPGTSATIRKTTATDSPVRRS